MIASNASPVMLSLFGEDWVIILIAIIFLFGGKKIPELMRGIGKGVREFNDAKDSVKNQMEEGMKEKDKDQEIRDLKQQMQALQQQKETTAIAQDSPTK
jgi:sec-independent protein translocase protein TatA